MGKEKKDYIKRYALKSQIAYSPGHRSLSIAWPRIDKTHIPIEKRTKNEGKREISNFFMHGNPFKANRAEYSAH